MNRHFIITGAAAALILAASSCTFVRYNGRDAENSFNDGIYDDADTENFDDSMYSDEIKTLDIKTGDFNAVVLKGFGDVIWTEGPASASIRGKERVIHRFSFDVDSNGTLTISCKNNTLKAGDKGVDITLSSPSLTGLRVSGAGDFKAGSPVRSDSPVNIKCLGAGDIEIDRISAPSVSCSVSGAGDIDLVSVEAKEGFEAHISGTGDLDIDRLTASNVEANISGTGDIDISNINAEKAKAFISGVGEIRISGRTDFVEATITGMGSIDISGLQYKNSSISKKGLGSIRTK